MVGTLRKISENVNELRTRAVVGVFPHLPEIGSRFLIFAEPLEEANADFRLVSTSLVLTVNFLSSRSILFETQNSTYQLELLLSENETSNVH